MELIERESFLNLLQTQFSKVTAGEGRCIFVGGEAGIGKTSLVKTFCRLQGDDCVIYQGACDALFTPRPLAPLYDIIWRLTKNYGRLRIPLISAQNYLQHFSES